MKNIFSKDMKPLLAGFLILAFAAGCTSNGTNNDKADANKSIDSLAQSKTAAQEEQKPLNEHQHGMGMGMGKSGQGMGHGMMMQKDHLMMQGGKMVMVKNGQDAIMDKDMTLSNGTRVRKDGTVEMKNGNTLHLQEGEMMDMNGEMGRM